MGKLPNVSTGDGWQCAGDRLRVGKLFGWDIGLTAGMLAGSMTRHRFWSVLAIHCVIPAWKAAALTGTG